MSRINIEDRLFSDPRLFKLASKMGSPQTALGELIFAWKLAQGFWKNGKRLVPRPSFEKNCSMFLVECEFAILDPTGEFYYLKGSKRHFQWLLDRQETGRIGGVKSAQLRELTRAASNEIIDENFKQKQAKASKSNPPTPTPSPTQENTILRNSVAREIEKIYLEHYPRKEGKTLGIKKLVKEIKTESDLFDLLHAIKKYSAYCARQKTEEQYIKHFSTFAGCWRDWLDNNAGTSTLKTERRISVPLE